MEKVSGLSKPLPSSQIMANFLSLGGLISDQQVA